MKEDRFCFSKYTAKLLLSIVIICFLSFILIYKIANLVNTKNTAITKSKAAESSAYLSTEVFNKKVYVIIFDPIVTDSGGKKIKFSEYLINTKKSYNDPKILTNKVISSFKKATENRINYSVTKQTTTEYFPISVKGTSLNREDLEYCIAHAYDRIKEDRFNNLCNNGADYIKIFDTYKICDDVNKSKVDEVWIWGYAYFGFSESALIGPNPFPYNGLTISNSKCNKLVPIMGFNYERGLGEALHDFGHRAEASMTTVYQNWSENRKKTKWDLFGLVKAQSTNYNYSGCGSGHYTPVSESDYDYDTGERTQDTVCDNFSDFNIFNSKDLLNKELKKTKINCKINPWLCTQEGYLEWWFSKFPKYKGIDSDGVLEDWLGYVVEPSRVNDYKAKISFKCTDYSEFGRVFGAKECENKKESDIQCKWFDFCNTCETKDKIIANVCPNFCPQFDNNIKGCTTVQEQGLGCVWVGGGVEKCISKTIATDAHIRSISPVSVSTSLISAQITIINNNTFNIEKKLLVSLLESVYGAGTEIISNKEISSSPLNNIFYKFILSEHDAQLNKINKYKIVPKLDFFNTKNPPNYTITTNQCPPNRQAGAIDNICYQSLPATLDYKIIVGKINCYNLGDPKTCDNANNSCSWSSTYGICYKKGEVENNEIKNFCSSIKLENICKNYSIDCEWKNSTCVFIKPVNTPMPTPTDSYKIILNAKLYNYRINKPNYMGENISGIANKFTRNLKYKLTYLNKLKVIRKEYITVELEKEILVYVKKGTDVNVEFVGDIITESCNDCSVVIASTWYDIEGKLSPNNSEVSFNNYKMQPESKITFGLFLTDNIPVSSEKCLIEGNSFCPGRNKNICFHFPQIESDNNKCFYCNGGTWTQIKNSDIGCFPKKLFN